MGTIKQGILGAFSGKVGNIVGGTWKGIDYMRILPASVRNPKTPKQLAQRARFIAILNFLKPLAGFLSVGFKEYADGMTGFNVAMSYNVKNAITGTYPTFTVNYPATLVSKGKLTGANTPVVASTVTKTINFTWINNSGTGNALASDVALLVAFFPTTNETVYQFTTILRSAATAQLVVPAKFSTKLAHCWLAFQSADGKMNSFSSYIGTVTVV